MKLEDHMAHGEAMFKAEDPVDLLNQWLAEAQAGEPANPTAMSLASVDESGMPNIRMVLSKHVDGDGIVFYTNFDSDKGRELAATPKAAVCYYWKSLSRQVRARGAVEPVSGAEADDYFATRPREARIGAWASDQSREIADRRELTDRVAHYTEKFDGAAVPRPPHWSGFRLVPEMFEFWHERPFRLHDRLVFERARDDAPWTKKRLSP